MDAIVKPARWEPRRGVPVWRHGTPAGRAILRGGALMQNENTTETREDKLLEALSLIAQLSDDQLRELLEEFGFTL